MNGKWKMENDVSPQSQALFIFHYPFSIFHQYDKFRFYQRKVTIQSRSINGDLFEWGVGSWEWGVVVEILRISNKIKSGTDLYRHSQLPTSNFKLLDKFQFAEGLNSSSEN